MTTELKPCPFCNGKGHMYNWGGHISGTFMVGCRTCGASTTSYSGVGIEHLGMKGGEVEAIEAWNTRANP